MTLHCRGQILDLSQPVVMGILNVTPDSFFDGGRYPAEDAVLKQVRKMISEGAGIIDVGGASTRPGAKEVSVQEELNRVIPVIKSIKNNFPEAILSIDTWRPAVAVAATEAGASMINDVSAGNLDPEMLETVAGLGVPYVLMHMLGSPETMQQKPHYEHIVNEVLDFFIQKLEILRHLGVRDILLDPGFGFGKTVEHNFQLLKNLHVFGRVLDLPVLAGVSRKSMICKVLQVSPANALNGTTALHMAALQQGARVLRVHDVKEAAEVIRLWEMMEKAP
ncbi:MAG: dihydropteroate synthase [Lewinellaceae bacterium]|nr:dihydropteroate synthase [Lewinellaceae bacterium]